jgi:hypothetical protein
MNTNKKSLLGVLGITSLVLAISKWKAHAEPEVPEEPEDEGGITITIRDEWGNIVPHNSPWALNEGAYYTMEFTVQNSSTRGDEPWAAVFTIPYNVTINNSVRVSGTLTEQNFAAGENRSFGPFGFSVPWDIKGLSIGSIAVTVKSPSGSVLDTDGESIDVIGVTMPKAIVNGIVIKNAAGTTVAPDQLSEDDSYNVYVNVTNRTTNGGVLVAGSINVGCDVKVLNQVIVSGDIMQSMTAGQTMNVGPFVANLPWDLSGNGIIDGFASHPTQGTLLNLISQAIVVKPDERYDASLAIVIKKLDGTVVTACKEGSTYNVFVNVTNLSKQGGVGVPITIPVAVIATVYGTKKIDTSLNVSLNADQTIAIGPFQMELDWDVYGTSIGAIDAMAYHPISLSLMKAGSVIFNVEYVPIVYGADVEIT